MKYLALAIVVFMAAGVAERFLSKKDNRFKRAARRFRRKWWD